MTLEPALFAGARGARRALRRGSDAPTSSSAQLEALVGARPWPGPRASRSALAYARAGHADRAVATLGQAAERYPDDRAYVRGARPRLARDGARARRPGRARQGARSARRRRSARRQQRGADAVRARAAAATERGARPSGCCRRRRSASRSIRRRSSTSPTRRERCGHLELRPPGAARLPRAGRRRPRRCRGAAARRAASATLSMRASSDPQAATVWYRGAPGRRGGRCAAARRSWPAPRRRPAIQRRGPRRLPTALERDAGARRRRGRWHGSFAEAASLQLRSFQRPASSFQLPASARVTHADRCADARRLSP